ncbi:hypothetical protein SIL85_20710 [Shewanella oneidensis]|uniref:hypothetical protein n=1 Tax=Shewanella oneidensis TaxID=70863 RepID=UPI00000E2115|nr:hypothetical protein [Shewanella oneidensis]MDX5999408.1 hypothetical protein [Shewanella oneidensis]MEE2026456.1 Glucose-1-phosphate thymidylyltransferase [Shewanella oneidensis]
MVRSFIAAIEKLQGLKVNFSEEVVFHCGWINAPQFSVLAQPLLKIGYGEYLLGLLNKQVFNEVH